MATNLLSGEDYLRILQNRFKTSNIKFISAELKSISENVEGFLGEHHNLHIIYKLDNKIGTEIFFFKNKPINNQLQNNFAEEVGAYKKEIFFYDHLLKEFNTYGFDTSFAAASYYCLPNEALVLENLAANGYQIAERYSWFSLAEIKLALKSIAMFHAAGFAYEKTKSKELNTNYSLAEEFSDILNEILYASITDQQSFSAKWSQGTFTSMKSLIDLLPKDESYKQKLKFMLENYKFAQGFAEKTDLAKTCGHGDLWSNNMMFKYEDKIPVQCCLLDFQICRYFYPCFDILIAIFCNTTPSFRKQHLQDLYQYYYQKLKTNLEIYGFRINEIMSIEDFNKSIKLMLPDVLFQVFNTLTVTCLPLDVLNSFVQKKPEGIIEFMFDNVKFCVEAFQTNETYRLMIIELFDEYYDIMLEYN